LILKNFIPTSTTVKYLTPIFMNLNDRLKGLPSYTLAFSNDNSAFLKTIKNEVKISIYPPPST